MAAIPKNAYGWKGGMPIISQAGASFSNKYGTGSVSFQQPPVQSTQVPQIPPVQVGMSAPTFVAGMPMVGAGATAGNAAGGAAGPLQSGSFMASMPEDEQQQGGRPSFIQESLNNAAQRWARPQAQQQQALKPMSAARRFHNATGRIDARATPSANNYTPAPVTFNKTQANWSPY